MAYGSRIGNLILKGNNIMMHSDAHPLTPTEKAKIEEITLRLRNLSSPVLKLQAILQFSQIVDMLALGDTSAQRIQELIEESDYFNSEYSKLAVENGLVDD